MNKHVPIHRHDDSSCCTNECDLNAFFRRESNISIRVKKGTLGDKIHPAVYRSDFLSHFTIKTLKKNCKRNVLLETYYREPSGSYRSVVALLTISEPQIDMTKKLLRGQVKMRELVTWTRKHLTAIVLWSVIGMGILTLSLISGCSGILPESIGPGFNHGGTMPQHTIIGRFGDLEQGTLCYWTKRQDAGASVSISCIERKGIEK